MVASKISTIHHIRDSCSLDRFSQSSTEMSLSSSIKKLNLNSNTSANSLKEMKKEQRYALDIVNQRLQTLESNTSESSPSRSKDLSKTGANGNEYAEIAIDDKNH